MTTLAQYLEQDAFTSHEREERQIVAVMPLLELYPVTADVLPVELPEPLEVIGEGAFVHVTPHFGKRPYFGWVKAVNGDRVTVEHWSFGYQCEHGIEEVRLHLCAAAAALEAGTASAV
jgi:hypothetical protein